MKNQRITCIYNCIDYAEGKIIYADSNIKAFHKGLNKIIKTGNYYALVRKFRAKDRFNITVNNKIYWLQRV